MTKKTETCSIDIEDSQNINFGNIHSDADKVFKLRKVNGLNTGDIFHFTKSDKEINQIFEIIKTIIETSFVERDVKIRALELSQNVKTSYQTRNSNNFGDSYSKLTGFLSDHIGLATFMLPLLQSIVQ